MRLGYNTNGLAHHRLEDAVRLLAEIGYESVAITIDHNALPPYDSRWLDQLKRLPQLFDELRMWSVIETGTTRFLLDPREKHEPTLISPDAAGRKRRVKFYKYAINCADALGSSCVSLWSGRLREGVARDQAMDWLVEGLTEVLDFAARKRVAVGFEPEPGMLIDSLRGFEELLQRIDREDLRLTLDVGHLHCQGETPIAEVIRRYAPQLVNVHLEDMHTGRHEHLMFGEGEIDFPPIFRALAEVGYGHGVHVELSRHSHEGPSAARRAMECLQQYCRDSGIEIAKSPSPSGRGPG